MANINIHDKKNATKVQFKAKVSTLWKMSCGATSVFLTLKCMSVKILTIIFKNILKYIFKVKGKQYYKYCKLLIDN